VFSALDMIKKNNTTKKKKKKEARRMSIVVVLVLRWIEYLLFSSIRLSFLHASMLNSLSRRSTLAYTDLFLCLDAVVIDSLSRLRIDYWERQIEQTYASCVYYFLASLSMICWISVCNNIKQGELQMQETFERKVRDDLEVLFMSWRNVFFV
jgi:hypothetical protein